MESDVDLIRVYIFTTVFPSNGASSLLDLTNSCLWLMCYTDSGVSILGGGACRDLDKKKLNKSRWIRCVLLWLSDSN